MDRVCVCVQCSCCQYNSVIGEAFFFVVVALVKAIIVCDAPMKYWALAVRKLNEWNDEGEGSICMHTCVFLCDLELLREFKKYWHGVRIHDHQTPNALMECNRSNPTAHFPRPEQIHSYRDEAIEYINASMNLHHANIFYRTLKIAFFLCSHVLAFVWNGIGRRNRARKGEWSRAAITLNLIMVINCGPILFCGAAEQGKEMEREREKKRISCNTTIFKILLRAPFN